MYVRRLRNNIAADVNLLKNGTSRRGCGSYRYAMWGVLMPVGIVEREHNVKQLDKRLLFSKVISTTNLLPHMKQGEALVSQSNWKDLNTVAIVSTGKLTTNASTVAETLSYKSKTYALSVCCERPCSDYIFYMTAHVLGEEGVLFPEWPVQHMIHNVLVEIKQLYFATAWTTCGKG